ncbi:MAG: TetR/AcrR family transcriptional regulator [Bacillota bacterium]|nr:TetR/AcrR family transcriptional regulator [Bacillota bacterium]
MTLKEKRQAERNELLLKRKENILEEALNEFCRKGIENTTIADVAKASEVGVASMYRYFSTKSDLVIGCASLFWEKEERIFTPALMTEEYKMLKGIEQIRVILQVFIKVFEQYGDFLKFIYEFDTYIRKEKIDPNGLMEYEKRIINIKPIFAQALEKGQKDHTINLKYNIDETYFTITHLLLSLSQKLAIYGDILEMDKAVEPKKQIEIAVDLLINSLKS